MSKKYVLLSALGHSMVFGYLAFSSGHASRTIASEMPCSAILEADLKPFKDQVRTIWVQDNLFMYVEIAKLFSASLDKDPALRAKIEEYKRGGKSAPSASELRALLTAKTDQLSGLADSLARKFGDDQNAKAFEWHYPALHIGELASQKIYFTLPVSVGSYELRVDLGPSSAEEVAGAYASAVRIISWRTGIILPHSGMAQLYGSEKDFLMRRGSPVAPRCLVNLYPQFAGLDLSLPPARNELLVNEGSSRGRAEGGWVLGFPVSEYQGGAGGGGFAAAPEAPEAPGAAPVQAAPMPPAVNPENPAN